MKVLLYCVLFLFSFSFSFLDTKCSLSIQTDMNKKNMPRLPLISIVLLFLVSQWLIYTHAYLRGSKHGVGQLRGGDPFDGTRGQGQGDSDGETILIVLGCLLSSSTWLALLSTWMPVHILYDIHDPLCFPHLNALSQYNKVRTEGWREGIGDEMNELCRYILGSINQSDSNTYPPSYH